MKILLLTVSFLFLSQTPFLYATDKPETIINTDIENVATDLTIPPVTNEIPAAGKRVRQHLKEFAGTDIYHVLYLPRDWKKGKQYPVIVEYAGNKYKTSLGTVEGTKLGYGISAGKGVIWISMPFVDMKNQQNATTWWGDVEATVDYCRKTVNHICKKYGGDSSALFIAGFSRGAIACNYIGLHDDKIAPIWRGFICHSHYDGVKTWNYAKSNRTFAAERLERLKNRPQFISHEMSIDSTKSYLETVEPDGNFTFVSIPFKNHTDSWVLRDIPEREILREWFRKTLKNPQK